MTHTDHVCEFVVKFRPFACNELNRVAIFFYKGHPDIVAFFCLGPFQEVCKESCRAVDVSFGQWQD